MTETFESPLHYLAYWTCFGLTVHVLIYFAFTALGVMRSWLMEAKKG